MSGVASSMFQVHMRMFKGRKVQKDASRLRSSDPVSTCNGESVGLTDRATRTDPVLTQQAIPKLDLFIPPYRVDDELLYLHPQTVGQLSNFHKKKEVSIYLSNSDCVNCKTSNR